MSGWWCDHIAWDFSTGCARASFSAYQLRSSWQDSLFILCNAVTETTRMAWSHACRSLHLLLSRDLKLAYCPQTSACGWKHFADNLNLDPTTHDAGRLAHNSMLTCIYWCIEVSWCRQVDQLVMSEMTLVVDEDVEKEDQATERVSQWFMCDDTNILQHGNTHDGIV